MEPTISPNVARHAIEHDMDYQLQRIADLTTYQLWMRKHTETLTHLRTYDIIVSFWANHADFNYLTHPQVIELMKAFPGHYNKSLSFEKDKLNYTLDTPVDGLTIRAYSGEPPAACKIEEHIEYIEVPAHTERKVTRKVICPDTNSAQPTE